MEITGFVIATYAGEGLSSVPFLVNRDWEMDCKSVPAEVINIGVSQKPCSVIANEVKQSINT